MDFRTLVELPVKELFITHQDKILLLGSCFAEHIGKLLQAGKFYCDINPFGILYNPFSVLKALDELSAGKFYKETDLFQYQGYWHSYMHHSSFSDKSAAVCLERINGRLQQASRILPQTNYLLITWGTAYVYSLKDAGQVVSNCHKLPDGKFTRRLLSVEEIVAAYGSFINILREINPRVKILFTVSPIRHVKDGLHRNQLSKSVLLLSIERLRINFPGIIYYFPSYEIMMDELRDYRFYADDMVHPSSLAIEYIWECFVKTYFNSETVTILKEWKAIIKALNHKPFHASAEQYKIFLRQNVLKIHQLKEKYPYLDVEKELEICHILLNR